MNSTRIAQVAAVAATIAWTAKAVVIGVAGGLGKSTLETPLFLLGLLCFVAAAVAYGASVTRNRATAVRLIAGIGACLAGVVIVVAIQGVLSVLGLEGHWVWTELNLWVVAGMGLALTRRLPSGGSQGVAVTDRAKVPSALRNP
jgi:hypothetical protein